MLRNRSQQDEMSRCTRNSTQAMWRILVSDRNCSPRIKMRVCVPRHYCENCRTHLGAYGTPQVCRNHFKYILHVYTQCFHDFAHEVCVVSNAAGEHESITAHPSATMTQKDYSITKCRRRSSLFRGALAVIGKRYVTHNNSPSAFASKHAFMAVASRYVAAQQQLNFLLDRSNRIAAIDFWFNFNRFGDREALHKFRFRVKDIKKLVPLLGWASSKSHSTRNRYSADPIVATRMILRRMAVPDRWEDLAYLFGKHPSQMSVIFWEGMELFVEAQGHLLMGPKDLKG